MDRVCVVCLKKSHIMSMIPSAKFVGLEWHVISDLKNEEV